MALYWPDQKVALQIDDDPAAAPFEGPDDWTVFHATTAMMDDFESFDALMGRLAEAIGEVPTTTDRDRRRRLFEMLRGRSDDADADPSLIVDTHTGEVCSWDEGVPVGSFELMTDGTRMSTPEFYYLREARKRTLAQQIQLAYELCGLYGTDHLEEGDTYRLYEEPVTSIDELRCYLAGARELDGYRQAMRALDFVAEGAASPAVSYLSILLTLPRRLGGYDLARPHLSTRLVHPITLERSPTEEGRFEAYDLCWPHQRVALQFVGDGLPNARERRALEAPDVADLYVVCITSRQMEDAETFEEAAHLLAERLDTPLPPSDGPFVEARDRLREELAFPHYDHMREMAEDWHWHIRC